MKKKKRHATIDDVIQFIEINAPDQGVSVKENPFQGRKFQYELVNGAILALHAQGRFLDLEVYDIKGTTYMWNTREGTLNVELARKATKVLLNNIKEKNPDKLLEEILPTITQEIFTKKPINRYQTKLGGMLTTVYDNSPYAVLIDLALHDQQLREYLPVIERLRHRVI